MEFSHQSEQNVSQPQTEQRQILREYDVEKDEDKAIPVGYVTNVRVDEIGEGPSTSIASEEDAPKEDDGGPVDKTVLTSFKYHMSYAIWNRKEVFSRFVYLFIMYNI